MISEKTDNLEPISITAESVQVSGTPTTFNIPPQDSTPLVNSDFDQDLSTSQTSEESDQPASLAILETELTNSEPAKHQKITLSEAAVNVDSETPTPEINLESGVINNTESFSKTEVESEPESSSITSTEVESRNLETGLTPQTLKNPDSSNIEVQEITVASENPVPEISIETGLASETLKHPDSSNIEVQEITLDSESPVPVISIETGLASEPLKTPDSSNIDVLETTVGNENPVSDISIDTGLASETLKHPDSSNNEVQEITLDSESPVPVISIETGLASEPLKTPDSSNIDVQEITATTENPVPDISNQPEEQQTQSGSQDETSNVQTRTQDPAQEENLQNFFNNLVDEPKEDSFISNSNVRETQTVHDLFIGDSDTQNNFAEIPNDSTFPPNSLIDNIDLTAQAFPNQDFEGVIQVNLLTDEERTGLEEFVSSITTEQVQEQNDPAFPKIDEDNGPFGWTTNPRFSRKRRSVIAEVWGHS